MRSTPSVRFAARQVAGVFFSLVVSLFWVTKRTRGFPEGLFFPFLVVSFLFFGLFVWFSKKDQMENRILGCSIGSFGRGLPGVDRRIGSILNSPVQFEFNQRRPYGSLWILGCSFEISQKGEALFLPRDTAGREAFFLLKQLVASPFSSRPTKSGWDLIGLGDSSRLTPREDPPRNFQGST